MHCASLGEFEQGRPVLEQLKKAHSSSFKTLVTFFSPSGYEVQKEYAGADFVFYLPMDLKSNADRFYKIVNPTLVIFVKYEYWYYYISGAKQRNIPLLLISGIFRQDQPFFKWYGSLYRSMLSNFTHFFVQNQASAQLLAHLGYNENVTISGDTRFDRVIEIAQQFEALPLIGQFCGNSKVIVAGSTWTEDDEELDHFANTHPDVKFIIAPHNIGKDRISECMRLYQHAITYTRLNLEEFTVGINTLIIDNIGLLSKLYHYGDICYVGGAFGADGVHNVLEPAVYGRPVVFGPVYHKYFEAEDLVKQGGGFSVTNALELERVLSRLLVHDEVRRQAGERSANYVYAREGSTKQIVSYIYKKRLFTS